MLKKKFYSDKDEQERKKIVKKYFHKNRVNKKQVRNYVKKNSPVKVVDEWNI